FTIEDTTAPTAICQDITVALDDMGNITVNAADIDNGSFDQCGEITLSSSMTNFSAEETRRVDWTFGIAYGDDYDKAKELLLSWIEADSRALKDPEPFIALSELADSSVNIVVRVWVNPADYWGLFFDMNEKVYKEFGKHALNIPFPQMDVHLDKIN
ncbi:MAG: hypothetical protein AAGC88_14165, partial [Bacteroidota bacterium]